MHHRHWHQQARGHCQQVQQTLVETPREQGQVQVDELHIKNAWRGRLGGLCYRGCQPPVVGAVVPPERSHVLAVRILWVVRWCVIPTTFWLCSDGWRPYVSAARQVFRQPLPRDGVRGRRPFQQWPRLVLVQVVKHHVAWRLVGSVRRVALGTWNQAFTAFQQTQGHGVFCTAWIERLNATFRARLHAWVRRGRARLRSPADVLAATYLVGTVYNCCPPHTTLSRSRVATTPAMAAGSTDTVWSLERLLTYHAPVPAWHPPAHRGRKPLAELMLIARWCPTRLTASECLTLRLHR